jgi:hypothetical protein
MRSPGVADWTIAGLVALALSPLLIVALLPTAGISVSQGESRLFAVITLI